MRSKLVTVFAVALLAVAGCGDDDDDSGDEGDARRQDGVVDVVAAAKIEALANELVSVFEEQEPDVDAQLEIAETAGALRDALGAGGADIALTPRPWAGPDADSQPLGRDLVAYAVPEGNPGGIGVESFNAGSGAETLVCSVPTPLGDFMAPVLSASGITPDPSAVVPRCEDEGLARVARGDLDAALMYRGSHDVPDGVEFVPIPDERNLVIPWVTVEAGSSDDAGTFSSFLDSDRAKNILEKHGYRP